MIKYTHSQMYNTVRKLTMEFSDLSVVRQVEVFWNAGNGEPRKVLDVEVPFEVPEGKFGPALANLHAMADCCRVALTQEPQSHGQQFGDFKVHGVYPYRLLPPEVAVHGETVARRIATVIVDYVRDVSVDMTTPTHEFPFEIDSDLPSQQIVIRSWMEFRLQGTNEIGAIELLMDYPEVTGPGPRKPIEDIKAFLSSVWAYCLGSQRAHAEVIDEMIKLRLDENRPLDELDRTIGVGYPSLYHPIGAGFGFPNAELRLTANDRYLPGEADMSTFLEEFLQRAAYRVPRLCL